MFTNKPNKRKRFIRALAAKLKIKSDAIALKRVMRYFNLKHKEVLPSSCPQIAEINQKSSNLKAWILTKESHELSKDDEEISVYRQKIEGVVKSLSASTSLNKEELEQKQRDGLLSLLYHLYTAQDIWIEQYLLLKKKVEKHDLTLTRKQLLLLRMLLVGSTLSLSPNQFDQLNVFCQSLEPQENLCALLNEFGTIVSSLTAEQMDTFQSIIKDRLAQGASTNVSGGKSTKVFDDLKGFFQKVNTEKDILDQLSEQKTYKKFRQQMLLASYGPDAIGADGKPTKRAQAFVEHHIDVTVFKESLKISDASLKEKDNLPDVRIVSDGYTLEKLRPGDYSGFFLGKLTDCCQSMAENSEACVIDGMCKETSGFYVLKKGNDIIGQCYAWISVQGNVVFDSLEVRKKGGKGASIYVKIAQKMFLQAAQEIVKQGPCTHVFVGAGGSTSRILGPAWPLIDRKKSDEHQAKTSLYHDSSFQHCLAINPGYYKTLLQVDTLIEDEYAFNVVDYFLSSFRDESQLGSHTKIINELLRKGADFYKFLENAASRGYIGEVTFLVNKGKNFVVKQTQAALAGACKGGHLPIVELLISGGITLTTSAAQTALIDACKDGKLDLIKIFIKNHAPLDELLIDKQPVLQWAQEKNHQNILELIQPKEVKKHP